MFTLRCTQKLLQRMHMTTEDLKSATTPEPTTALGDRYAHLLILQRQHLVMFVSDRSRLCILTTARDVDRLTQRFHYAAIDLFRAIDVPEGASALERHRMGRICYGLPTGMPVGRSVLGSIRDYTNALRNSDLSERSLPDLNLYSSDRMCGPLDYRHPGDVTRQLLADALARTVDSSSATAAGP